MIPNIITIKLAMYRVTADMLAAKPGRGAPSEEDRYIAAVRSVIADACHAAGMTDGEVTAAFGWADPHAMRARVGDARAHLNDYFRAKRRRLSMVGSCLTCLHWRGIAGTRGECRRYPPISGLWPTTLDNDSCGELQPVVRVREDGGFRL